MNSLFLVLLSSSLITVSLSFSSPSSSLTTALSSSSSYGITTRSEQRRHDAVIVSATDVEEEEDVVITFDDSEFDEDDEEEDSSMSTHSRWSARMKPKSKLPKVKRDPAKEAERKETKFDKRMRRLRFMREVAKKRKRERRVERKIPLDSRIPLSVLTIGSKWKGTVISLVPYGAYIDIGTECDGLLHISQISDTNFVERISDVFTLGDEIDVRVNSFLLDEKKLHLTMLPVDVDSKNDDDDDENNSEKIPLEEIEVDDELWGEITRVTDFGGYVEVGTEVKGFLHFMDHPFFTYVNGVVPPSTYMEIGQRVRIWVSDVDRERKRIKLTANRPTDLPGPRREIE